MHINITGVCQVHKGLPDSSKGPQDSPTEVFKNHMLNVIAATFSMHGEPFRLPFP